MTHTVLVHAADQLRSRTDSHGIINFTLGLLGALPASLPERSRLVILTNEEMRPELAGVPIRAGDELVVLPPPRSMRQRLWVDHIEVLRQARRHGADCILFPKGFVPFRPRGIGRSRLVAVLHDDIAIRESKRRDLPRSRRARFAFFAALTRWSLRRADQRLFVSAFTAHQLTEAAGRRRRLDDLVILEGISLPRRTLVSIADKAPRALVLGSTLRHKRTGPGLDLIAGSRGLSEMVEQVMVVGALDEPRSRAGSLPIEHISGPLTGSHLAGLIAESRLLVYPSEYEGFGLPPIEAYALGTPTVFRRTGAAAELLSDYPGAFDQESQDPFEAAVAEVSALDDAQLADWSERTWTTFDWGGVAARVAAAVATPSPA